MSKKRVYIAGPMKGIPWFNFPEFDEAARFINDDWPNAIAVNPADIDREKGFDPNTLPEDYDWNVIPEAAGSKEEIIRRDLNAVLSCDSIYMLPGWEKSAGAKAELHVARWAGLKIHHHSEAAKPHRGQIAEDANFIEYPNTNLHRLILGNQIQCDGPSEANDHLDLLQKIVESDKKEMEGIFKKVIKGMIEAKPAAVKDSNPKDNVGSRKPGISAVPCKPLQEAGLALQYGGSKYGKHNWRHIGVRASVYYDAAMRHLMAWWEGEDIDPIDKGGSGLPHLAHAIAGLMVYRDAELAGMVTDDRPIATGSPYAHLEAIAAEICDRYPNPVAPYTQKALSNA